MWVTKLLISPVKKRIFCPKTTKFGPKLAFLVDMGLAMQAYSVPCWWVGWWLWRAGCISQDTYLLYGFCCESGLVLHKKRKSKRYKVTKSNSSLSLSAYNLFCRHWEHFPSPNIFFFLLLFGKQYII